MDSVTSISDIKEGYIQSVSYSDGWAAPEQKQGKIGKLCPATDIYSIGAILFEKIMGRVVSVFDTNVFARWDFDQAIFENVNPAIKCHLEDLFKRTLAASVKRRFQNVSELIQALEKALQRIEAPFLISNCPTIATDIIGRTNELLRIHAELEAGKHAIFLHGFGGIGKSTLAIAYGNHYAKAYSTVLFLEYRTSLQDLLEEIEIQKFEGSELEERKCLKRLLDEETLVIIDNFDVPIDGDDGLEELFELKAKILFTTRTDFSTVYSGNVGQIEVGALPYEQQLELFRKESKLGLLNGDSSETVRKILKRINGHTFSIILYARQLWTSGWSTDELLGQMECGFAEWHQVEKVRYQKDRKAKKSTIPDAISVLFRIAELSEDMKRVLRNVYVLSRAIHVNKTQYRRFICADIEGSKKYDEDNDLWYYSFDLKPHKRAKDIDILNELEERGYISNPAGLFCSVGYYVLHPLIEELIVNELKADDIHCPQVYEYVDNLIQTCLNPQELDEAEEAKHEAYREFLAHFFANANYDIACNLRIALHLLKEINESPKWYPFGMVYAKLEKVLKNPNLSVEDVFEIHFVFFCGWLSDYRRGRRDSDREERLLKCFKLVNSATLKLPAAVQALATSRIVQAIVDTMNGIHYDILPSDVAGIALSQASELLRLSPEQKKGYGIPLSEEEIAEERCRKEELENDEDYQDLLIDREWRDNWRNDFIAADDKIKFIQEIISDESYEEWPSLRTEAVTICTDVMFSRIQYSSSWHYSDDYFDTIGWEKIAEILVEENNLLQNEGTDWTWSQYRRKNLLNRIIAYAMLNNQRDFDDCVALMDQIMSSEIKHGKTHWTRIVNPKYGGTLEILDKCVRSLITMKRSSMILPYLLSVAKKCEEYAQKQPDFEERDLYALYELVAECADDATYDDICSQENKRFFSSAEQKYRDKMDAIVGVTYHLNWESEET